MMDGSLKLPPPGYRFNPFEEELISFYLKPKVLGQKLSCNVVHEKHLYGPNANPWQLFHPENHPWILSEVAPGKFEKVTYAFVNLTKKAVVDRENKTAAARYKYIKRAGCGTWHAKTKRSQIKDRVTGDLIGEKRLLVFQINDDSHLDLSKVGYWKMHEFHLCGVNEDVSNPDNTVLCKITLDYSKNPPVCLHSKKDHDHRVTSSGKQHKKMKKDDTNATVHGHQSVSENRDDLDSYRDKGKEGGCETGLIEICDEEECINSNCVEENAPSEQLDTGYLKPVSSDFSWPAYGDDYKKLKMKEQSVEDTTNLAKDFMRDD